MIPYPPAFGGLVDVYYKIVWLHKMGFSIYLHCFTEDDADVTVLNSLCEKVYVYPRNTGISGLSIKSPYIVSSRRSTLMLSRLLDNSHPILFEGIHTTAYLQENHFSNRQVFVRLFNTEFIYYRQLAVNERNWIKKLYYKVEALQLEGYERRLAKKAVFLALSLTDEHYYSSHLGANDVQFLPAFLPYNNVTSLLGCGTYCLYHGNLSINENEAVVIWLITEVFSVLDISFIVAGKQPSKRLFNLIKTHKNITLIANPTDNEMQGLVADAHINILPSFNATGVKLKLLNTLFNGRHCLVNKAGVAGSNVEALCEIAETSVEIIERIQQLMQEPFTQLAVDRRTKILGDAYNNNKNITELTKLLH